MPPPEPAAETRRDRRPRVPPAWRWGLAVVGVPVLVLVLGWAWQAISLARIPDVGDPFDVAAFKASFPDDLPDDRNAFAYYQQAQGALPSRFNALGQAPAEDWALATTELKERFAACREGLDLWRRGAECDGAVYHRLHEMSVTTLLPVTQELRNSFSSLPLLEGSRLEAEGDMAGAWGVYRALLRTSRHSGTNGFIIERLVGAAVFRAKAAPRVRRWAADPRVDAESLRRALADVRAIGAMTAPTDGVLKLEYLINRGALDDPKQLAEMLTWTTQGNIPPPTTTLGRFLVDYDPGRWLRRQRATSGFERERSRRVLALLWANRLAQVGRPPGDRAAAAVADPLVYAADPSAPPAARALDPATLARLYKATPLHNQLNDGFASYLRSFDKERAEWGALVVALAGEVYRRDRGAPPPSPESLVPDYLDRLPDTYRPEVFDADPARTP